MTRPSPHELLAETARLAFHLHWPLDTLLDLEHADRRAFLEHADALAQRFGTIHVGEDVVAAAAAVVPPAEPDPVAGQAVPDFESIEDPRVRRLFETYYGGAA